MSNRYNETKDLFDFFKDIAFAPPEGRGVEDFVDLQDEGVLSHASKETNEDSYDEVLMDDMADNPYNSLAQTMLSDTSDDHPNACNYSDFFMFSDPGARNSYKIETPKEGNNLDYEPKDLSEVQSFSDVHLEDLEQPSGEFPRHVGITSRMEPSEVFDDVFQESFISRPLRLQEGMDDAFQKVLGMFSNSSSASKSHLQGLGGLLEDHAKLTQELLQAKLEYRGIVTKYSSVSTSTFPGVVPAQSFGNDEMVVDSATLSKNAQAIIQLEKQLELVQDAIYTLFDKFKKDLSGMLKQSRMANELADDALNEHPGNGVYGHSS
jgi:hypothetical protein